MGILAMTVTGFFIGLFFSLTALYVYANYFDE